MIAAINGPAIGLGLTLVLPMDQIVATTGAKLSARFVKMGLVPELASSHFLTARCGFGAASWLALSGTTVLAEEALRLGLVDRVTAPDALLDEAMAMAAELAANPPTQLRLIKQLLSANADETDLAVVQRRAEGAQPLLHDARARRSRAGVPRAPARLPLTSVPVELSRTAAGRR